MAHYLKVVAAVILGLIMLPLSVQAVAAELPKSLTLEKTVLMDKIKGAWAGQTIGVSYGFPVEFQYNSTMVPDSHTLAWFDGYMKMIYELGPGIYDDIYMDLTFVQVLEDEGMDAPAISFAKAYAKKEYPLWAANQVGRYNIRAGMEPPATGHWLNNPSADDIDFQIEADFAGIMNPGMVNSAIELSDRVGHIMNYGDGWYGGVFVASMYSLAFVSSNIPFIVNEALKVIPEESTFHQVIADAIRAHSEHPDDWKAAWFEVHRKWADTDRSPDGAFSAYNIDAKINAAWVVLGLLYGDGDFTRTIEIATRGGDDADCNPATAAGILGVVMGYDAIPAKWKLGLSAVEPMDFAHTTISLNDAYQLSFNHALQMIERNEGSVDDDEVTIPVQKPQKVDLEQSYVDHYPVEKRILSYPSGPLQTVLEDHYSVVFEGVGFVLLGRTEKLGDEDHVLQAKVIVDGVEIETANWPTDENNRRFHLAWKFELPRGKHTLELQLLNPTDKAQTLLESLVVYDNQPANSEY